MPDDPDGDPFRPPTTNTTVGCLHCQEVYDSYQIVWREVTYPDGNSHGFWCCPTPDCDGKGFGFDIFPTDPDYVDENGERMWVHDDGDEDEEWADDESIHDTPPPREKGEPGEDIPY